jgi:hypothetical protein
MDAENFASSHKIALDARIGLLLNQLHHSAVTESPELQPRISNKPKAHSLRFSFHG